MIEVTVLEVAQLDDLLVDRNGRNRIKAGRRLVVEHDARLGGHGSRDRHAAALPAGELRRHAIDELVQSDEAEHLLDARVVTSSARMSRSSYSL